MLGTAAKGAGWGFVATFAMTAVMLLATMTGLSPLPRPVPIALAAWVLGSVPPPVLLLTGALAHFAYGAGAGAVFALLVRRRANVWSGLAFGAALWLVMGLVFLPLLHWGPFGIGITPGIAGATLVLHSVYGAVLGGCVSDRREEAEPPLRSAA